jgi:tRNA dimethylallyltransferase
LQKIKDLFRSHDKVILVGGSGLYTEAVLHGLDNFPRVLPGIRESLKQEFDKNGLQSIQDQLKKLDPNYYQVVDLHNPHRLIRALEVCLSSGKPYSSFLGQPRATRPFKAIVVGLQADREVLYQRINARVDQMINKGLVEEVKQLLPYKTYNALQTVGYKEIFQFLEGTCSLETAVDEIKKNTRRFAKRQLTWYRKSIEALWFDYETPHEEIALELNKQLDQLK